MRTVIYHKEWGIYLGSCMGMGFWTKLDPAGQDSAVTFASQSEAEEVIATWDHKPEPADLQFVAVKTKYLEGDLYSNFATRIECVAAGLDAWDPNAIIIPPAPTREAEPFIPARGVPATHGAMRAIYEEQQIDIGTTTTQWSEHSTKESDNHEEVG